MEQQMNISKMTLEQLKVLAYDQIILMNQVQANLNVLQLEINKRQVEVESPETKKK